MDQAQLIQSDYLSSEYNCTVYLKPEWFGPTGSHKDKWAKIAIKLAIDAGANKVVVMSSGNQGLALAAEACNNGISCRIITSPTIRPVYLELYKKYNATVSFVEEQDEMQAFERCVQEGYYPLGITHEQREKGMDLPGIEGYKISAQEIIDSVGSTPDLLIFPTAYSDHPQGVLRGFEDLLQQRKITSIPQFILARAKYPEGDLATSIVTDKTTPYVTNILNKTKGEYFFLSNREMLEAQKLCEQITGWNIEVSSAAAIAALNKLPPGDITGKTIVIVLTALER